MTALRALTFALLPALAAAEPPVSAGDRIRVLAAPEPSVRTGTVLTADARSLTVAFGSDAPVIVALPAIERLEVARGKRTAAREGAVAGGVGGLLLGVAVTALFSAAMCDVPGGGCEGAPEAYLLVGGIGAAAGAGVGALAGLAFQKDRWERVPLDRVRVGVAPVRRGAGVQVSLAWGGR